MKNKKISIIVPCYNVEKFVEKTINCLINQTYKNIEIIVVEDCSTDGTYNLLKELVAKHNQYSEKIKLFRNEKNSGLACTRNRGMERATGEYIGFIDSDDFVDKNYFEVLVDSLEKVNADIAICDIVLADEKGEKIAEPQAACQGSVNKINVISNGMAASSCNKIFKKELIEKYPFLEGKINEDVSSIIPAIVHANKISYTNKVYYYYVQRNTSIQNSKFSNKRYDMFDAINVCLERIKGVENYEEYREILLFHQILMLYVYVIIEQDGFSNRYILIKEFIKRSCELKLYNLSLFKTFLNTQRKTMKCYYYILVNLLKFKATFFINLIIEMKKSIKSLKYNGKNKLKRLLGINVIRQNLTIEDLVKKAKKQNRMKDNKIAVSVVVPNYNYEKFLIQRLYSILNQTEKIYELIILDDCSKDNSRELIDKIIIKLEPYIKIKKVYNEKNSGIAFKQWSKGFKMAKGQYVWIAEADDVCDKTLLKNLLKPIKQNLDKQIYISYADTAFVNAWACIFLKSIKPEIDIMKTGHWNSSFVHKGEDEVKEYSFLNCTIANVSSCIIKNDNYDEIFDRIIEYRQAGDWLFYVNVMRKGYVAYVDKTLNYYRVHGENITSKMKKQKHLDEIKKIHFDIKNHFELNDWHEQEMQKRYDFLTEVWNLKK